ncbi:MAG: ester cyclase [Acidobacteria bacterium]|nr:ester cyclase [Acidobacteriota bacterium]
MTKSAFVSAALAAFLLACSGQPRVPAAEPGPALLAGYVRAWNQHDFAALDTLLTPDAVHDDIAQGFHGQGPGQIKDFMRELIKLEPDFNWRLTTVVAAGSPLAAEWTWTATYTGPSPGGPVVGRRISGQGASIVVIENGRIKRFADYYDVASFFPPMPATSTGK